MTKLSATRQQTHDALSSYQDSLPFLSINKYCNYVRMYYGWGWQYGVCDDGCRMSISIEWIRIDDNYFLVSIVQFSRHALSAPTPADCTVLAGWRVHTDNIFPTFFSLKTNMRQAGRRKTATWIFIFFIKTHLFNLHILKLMAKACRRCAACRFLSVLFSLKTREDKEREKKQKQRTLACARR